MATTLNEIKELQEADTPLLFFECTMPSNASSTSETQYWCTHAISFNGQSYEARVLKHNLFDLQLSVDDAMEGLSQLSIVLADADSQMAQLNANYGFKGATLTLYFAFADLTTGTITTESTVLFNGIAGDPDEITEDSLTLTFTNKLSLQRIPIPEVRVQRSCPWTFPATLSQRSQAADSNAMNRFSQFYRCGYSADVPGGVGNLMDDGQAYTSCNKSRSDCQARGMFNIDSANRVTARFGGLEFVPSAVMVRTSGSSTSHISPLLDNSALYNDAVPIVYGEGWLKAPVVFSRNDGNLTHMEVLLGMGQIGYMTGGTGFTGVLKVVVNDIEIPLASSAQDMTTTGWYNVFATGTQNGAFNYDFSSNGQALGDPYGSMAAMSVVVPNRICSGTSLADVEVLLQGVQVDSYDLNGDYLQTAWSDNPAWILLDILQRSGWSREDLDLSTFATSAAFCSTLISALDVNGNPTSLARYKCNLILTKRQSAAVIVRGIRVASSLMLRYGINGSLQLLPETTISQQQPVLPDGGNSLIPFDQGGWPAYEFSDGSLPPFSGIVRNADGTSSLRFVSRSIVEVSNRLSVEFQDESNEYQQDSLSVVDSNDSGLIGYEISSQSTALGIANFSQASRVLLQQLDKSIYGNLFVEFQTSFRALKTRPGDIIAVSLSRPILAGAEGNYRIPFRVIRLSPSLNYQLVTILAQIHDDDWYSDNIAVLGGPGRQPSSQVQTPLPLIGLTPHYNPTTGAFEFFDFLVTETTQTGNGLTTDSLTIGFSQPSKPNPNLPSLPVLSLASQIETTSGSIPANTSYYYAISAVDSLGNEGPLSFTVLAQTISLGNTNSVTLNGLSFPAWAMYFNVYRGTTPQMMYQIASSVNIFGVDGQPVTSYIDTGASPKPIGPPDANFDHANFYWRYEYSPAYMAVTFTSTTIGTGAQDLWATPGVYVGKVVRILDGTGTGQERSITGNDATTLTITPAWSVIPDATSMFVVTEGAWTFAAVSATSPVQFDIPYQSGDAIQITGRGANVNNQEGMPELCPLTRWTLGAQTTDGGVPPLPAFQVATPGGGEVTLSQIGFTSVGGELANNTESISTGTLQVFYWNEVSPPPNPYALAAPLDASTTTILPGPVTNPPPSYAIQIGSEIMTVVDVDLVSNTYTVERGVLGSSAASHKTGDPILHLDTSAIIVPFSPGFFGNSASINYIHTFSLPDARIAASEFFVTNSFGDSPTAVQCSAGLSDGGLRTLSGGQFSLQVSGYLATEQNVAPPLIAGDAPHSVRDARATVSQAPSGYNISVDVLQNGSEFCNLTIASGNTVSAVTDGVSLPFVQADATLTMNVTLIVANSGTTAVTPGQDLTVTIRF